MGGAGEAEAGSAGEQPAEESPAETHCDEAGLGCQCILVPFAFLVLPSLQ
jgi:hypothetical protein